MYIKLAALTVATGLALGAAPSANAVGRFITSNAVDKCQAFTPGPANTIRNRVIGSQNVGSAPIAVACVFELNEISGGGSVDVSTIVVYFKNDGASPATVTCTKLIGSNAPGFGAIGGSETISTPSMAAGATSSVTFEGIGGAFAVGVNCTLPQDVTLTATRISYMDGQA